MKTGVPCNENRFSPVKKNYTEKTLFFITGMGLQCNQYYFLIRVDFLIPTIILFEQCEVHGSRLAFFKQAARLWLPSLSLQIDEK